MSVSISDLRWCIPTECGTSGRKVQMIAVISCQHCMIASVEKKSVLTTAARDDGWWRLFSVSSVCAKIWPINFFAASLVQEMYLIMEWFIWNKTFFMNYVPCLAWKGQTRHFNSVSVIVSSCSSFQMFTCWYIPSLFICVWKNTNEKVDVSEIL